MLIVYNSVTANSSSYTSGRSVVLFSGYVD